MINAHYSKNRNLIVKTYSNQQGGRSGMKLLWKVESLKQHGLADKTIQDLERDGYTKGGYSALDWLLEMTDPDKVLSYGYIVK